MIPLKILLYDSGTGGINLLVELKKQFFGCDFYYMSDSKNFPYGTKSRSELLKIATENLDFVGVKGFDIVVLACNTLTTSCLEEFKKIYPTVLFCGVEPLSAVKKNKKTMIFCTSTTRKNIFGLLQDEFVGVEDLDGLVRDVEKNIFRADSIDVKKYVRSNMEGVEKIILGCTHFCFVKKSFKESFSTCFIDDGFMPIKRRLKNYISTFDHQQPLLGLDTKNFLDLDKSKFIFSDNKRNFKVYQKLIFNR